MLFRLWCLLALCSIGISRADELVVPASAELYQKTDCELTFTDIDLRNKFSCGLFQVKSADGSRFQLQVVRRAPLSKITGKVTESPTVLYLPDGAGSSAVAQLLSRATTLLPEHQLIAFDSRGSGGSRPQFCPQLAGALNQAFRQSGDDSSWLQARQQLLQQCQQQMLSGGFSPADFGTAQTVKDAEALRLELGIEQWQLYASRGGTTIALHYLATARRSLSAVLLDAVTAPDDLLSSYKVMQDQWLRQLERLCQQQPDCQAHFGPVPDLFNKALTVLSQQPLSLQTPDGKLTLTPDKLRWLVWHSAQQERLLSLIPWWLEAISRRDSTLPAHWFAQVQSMQPAAVAAQMATECADRARHYQRGRADSLEQQLLLPDGSCESFGGVAEPPAFPLAAQVQLPVLVLAPALDVQQSDVALLTQWLGPHAQLFALPGLHSVLHSQDPCAVRLAQSFLQTPRRFAEPDCVAAISPPYLVSALELQPAVAAELQRVDQGLWPSWPVVVLMLLVVLAGWLGVIWPALCLLGRWLLGAELPVQRVALLSSLLVMLILGCWLVLFAALAQVLVRHSGEILLGIPAMTQGWRLAIVLALVAQLALMWWLARLQYQRQLLAQLLLAVAMFGAVYLHWLL